MLKNYFNFLAKRNLLVFYLFFNKFNKFYELLMKKESFVNSQKSKAFYAKKFTTVFHLFV